MKEGSEGTAGIWTGIALLVGLLVIGLALSASAGGVFAGAPIDGAPHQGKVRQATQPQVSGRVTNQRSSKPADPTRPHVVLHDQYDNAGSTSTSSQNFEATFDAFDNELADDFVNPGPDDWQVQMVEVDGQYFNGAGPTVSYNLTFYNNSGGMPVSVLASRPIQAYTDPSGGLGDVVITLSSAVSIPPGTYWMSIVANMEFAVGGQWGWTDRTVQTGNSAMWQNPGDGFDSGCITWGTKTACGITTASGPDQVFRLSGTAGPTVTPGGPTNTPTRIPTATCIPVGYAFATGTATMVAGVTDIGNHADDLVTNINLPFSFTFYGQTFNSVGASSNGNLQFTSTNASYTNACLPTTPMANLISPHWDDLLTDSQAGCAGFPGDMCGIYTAVLGSAPNRTFVIEWRAVHYEDRANPINFEVKLHEGNTTFEMVYGPSSGTRANGVSATVGLQQGTGSLYTQFECNTGGLSNGMRISWNFTSGACPTHGTPAPTHGTHAPTYTPTNTPCPGAWTTQAAYPTPVLDNAVASQGGILYSFAGVSNSTTINNAYKYDPGTNTWTDIALLPAPREQASAVSDGTYIYILGGRDNTGANTPTNYRYNPATDTYTAMAPLTVATWAQAVAYLNGKLYKVAGCGTNCGSFLDTVEEYNIGTNTWATKANYPIQIGWHMCTGLGNFVYCAGGVGSGIVESLKTYRYDPSTNVWDDAAIADLPATRWGAAEAIVKGRWMLAGGYSVGVIVNSTLQWNPGTNTWGAKDPMLAARARMSGDFIGQAMYVVGGRDPVIGGFNGNNDNQRFIDICQTPVATDTPTRTPTSTPTPTVVALLVGHVTWQGRPAQPDALQQLPITLTLKSGATEVNYPSQNTDANGFFTVSVSGLVSGTYDWRVKGPKFLANSGIVTLSGSSQTNVEMGQMRAADANDDNAVSISDFNILKSTFGLSSGDPAYDDRADFTGDFLVNVVDFNLLKGNFGVSGSPPLRPGAP